MRDDVLHALRGGGQLRPLQPAVQVRPRDLPLRGGPQPQRGPARQGRAADRSYIDRQILKLK